MLTGKQLRAARLLLGLSPSKMAERLGIPTSLVKLAEANGMEELFTPERAQRVRAYFESRGIEFLPEGSDPSARLVDPLRSL